MVIGLVIILLMALILPLTIKFIERNLELFLLSLGIISVAISRSFSKELLIHIFDNRFLYMITLVVLISGVIFRLLKSKIRSIIHKILQHISLDTFVFLIILILGIFSSVITAIIASLFFVQIIKVLNLTKRTKIILTVFGCLSIGLGASLTPIGEPLSTIVISRLHADFWYIINLMAIQIVINILFLALLGYLVVDREIDTFNLLNIKINDYAHLIDDEEISEEENIKEILYMSAKVFLFIVALELLGAGFKPIIDIYIVRLDSRFLYWLNTISAILDNATLVAAEISPKMTNAQIRAILMGLLISGGMLIPGNIPNIISSAKLKINSKEWMKIGIPLVLVLLLVNYIILFIYMD